MPGPPPTALRTDELDWIPTAPGNAFRPLRFEADGWSELMRLEPGSGVPRHRHTGDVDAFTLSGTRQILDTGELIGPGDYVHESAGTVDAWRAVGEVPCVVHIRVRGAVEFLDAAGRVVATADSASQRAAYLDWCRRHGIPPAPQLS